MQSRPLRPSRFLSHHLMQTPDDRSSPRRAQRHAQSKGVDRHGVSRSGGVEVVHIAWRQGGEGVPAFLIFGHLDATASGSVQGLQPGLQRHKGIRA